MIRIRGSFVGLLLSLSCRASPAPDVGARSASGAMPAAAIPATVDAGEAAPTSTADAAGDVATPPEPAAHLRACSAVSFAPGTEWKEEIRAARSTVTDCYGGNLPWLGHIRMTKKVLAADDGGVRDLRVRYEVGRDANDDKSDLEGRSLRFARTLGGPTVFDEAGVALEEWSRDEMLLDGAEVSDALPWPIPKRELTRDELVPALGPSVLGLVTRTTLANVTREPRGDYPQTLTATVRFAGQESRDWGTVRVFKAQVRASIGSAGMCHHWITTWSLDGTLAFPVHADTLVEAHWSGTIEAKEGLCQGCGKDKQSPCPERRCWRGTFESTVAVSCVAPAPP